MTFEVDGFRFGCAVGMEAHYPEIFIEYEQLNVDCVLFSTAGETASGAPAFAAEVLGHAASNTFGSAFQLSHPRARLLLRALLRWMVSGQRSAL